ncbi:MAG: hypothetical protein WA982_00515 [Rubrobacteraceae bacterium]
MILPTLSVTVVGLIGAAVGGAMRMHAPLMALARGLVGAWGGFAAGALIGVLIDVVTQTGIWLGIVGHLAAVAGTVVAIRLRTSGNRESSG